jgi:hypothetical protein
MPGHSGPMTGETTGAVSEPGWGLPGRPVSRTDRTSFLTAALTRLFHRWEHGTEGQVTHQHSTHTQ